MEPTPYTDPTSDSLARHFFGTSQDLRVDQDQAAQGLLFLQNLPRWTGWENLNVETIARVLRVVGNPQDRYPSIHIGGTNGKGSVSATTAAILGAKGAKVGLTISPHLTHFNERIVIDGRPVDFDKIGYYANRIRQACEVTRSNLTAFQGITATAFLLFAGVKVDYAVVEVGVGGRHDATNVLRHPEAAAVVSIGLDHEFLLGPTIESVAHQKVGIVKSNSKLVIGKLEPNIRAIFEEECASTNSSISIFGKDFVVTPNLRPESSVSSSFLYTEENGFELAFESPLPGAHQSVNVGIAIRLARLLGASPEEISLGIRNVFWPARLEIVSIAGKTLMIDGAHNPAGVSELCGFLAGRNESDLSVAFGALRSKNWTEMVDMMRPFAGKWNLLTPHDEDAIPGSEIAKYLMSYGISAEVYDSKYEEYLRSVTADSTAKSVLWFGSLHLVGPLRGLLNLPERPYWIR